MSGGTSAAGGAAAGGSMFSGANMMMGMQIAAAVNQGVAARSNAVAQQNALNYQAQVSANNAKIAQWQAQDALQRGARTEQTQRLKTAQLKGAQRASLAARGISLDEGSALNLLQDTDFMGDLDVATIQDNTTKEAWGFENQANNALNDAALMTGRAQATSPNAAMFGTLLTGAGSVADSWYRRSSLTAAQKAAGG